MLVLAVAALAAACGKGPTELGDADPTLHAGPFYAYPCASCHK